MTDSDLLTPRWRMSSFSGSENNCVEVSLLDLRVDRSAK
ncbi:DUF397 domain-containing protein [Actinoallomurus spadix]